MPQHPGREGHRAAVRFEVAWRQVDDEALRPTHPAVLEPRGNHLDIGCHGQNLMRVQFHKGALDEAREVVAEDRVVLGI